MNPFRPNKERRQIALIAIYFMMVMEVLNITSVSLTYYNLEGNNLSEILMYVSEVLILVTGVMHTLLYVVSGILFIMWFRRAYWNLHQVIKPLQYDEGWAAGAWFIPIMNLFRPVAIMKDILGSTNYLMRQYKGKDANQVSTEMVGFWWTCWILGGILSNISARMYLRYSSFESYHLAMLLDVISSLLFLVAGMLIVDIIKGYAPVEDELQDINIESGPAVESQPASENYRT